MLKTDFKILANLLWPIMSCKYPIMLRGKHGIGKSDIVQQLANYIGVKALIDKRASQMQEGDLLGLPKLFEKDGKNTTVWYPPDWYNFACDEPCILFLDELDRASPEVRQGFFELADSRKINGQKLHEGTHVMAAINGGSGDEYQTYELDPAEQDRWVIFDVSPSTKDFLDYMAGNEVLFDVGNIVDTQFALHKQRIPNVVIDFLSSFPEHIEHSNGEFISNVIYPSRRSWHRFGRVLWKTKYLFSDYWSENRSSYEELKVLCNAFVGEIAADKFTAYFANYIKINNLDIFGPWDEISSSLQKLDFGVKTFLMQNLFASGKILEVVENKQKRENVVKFFDFLPAESKSLFINLCLSKTNENLVHSLFEESPSINEFLLIYAKESEEKYKKVRNVKI